MPNFGKHLRAPAALLAACLPVKERLGLTVAPVIVAQQGKKLVLTEYAPIRAAGGSARP